MVRKYRIALDDFEYRIVVNALNELRSKLIQDGRYTDAVYEVLLKVVDSPIRRVKTK